MLRKGDAPCVTTLPDCDPLPSKLVWCTGVQLYRYTGIQVLALQTMEYGWADETGIRWSTSVNSLLRQFVVTEMNYSLFGILRHLFAYI